MLAKGEDSLGILVRSEQIYFDGEIDFKPTKEELALKKIRPGQVITLTARNAKGETVTAQTTATARPVPVRYAVTFGGDGGTVTIENPESGATEQNTVYSSSSQRWSRRYPDYIDRPIREGAFLYVSAQNGEEGCVVVAIYVHGIKTKDGQSCGPYTIASVSGSYTRPLP